MALTNNSNPSTQHPTQPPPPPTQPGWDLTTGIFGHAPFAMNGEYYKKMKNDLTELFKSLDPKYQAKVLDLTKEVYISHAFSCLMICVNLADMPDQVAIHTLLLEKTGERPGPMAQTVNNRSYTLHPASSDAIDRVLLASMKEVITTNYRGKTPIDAGFTVIPQELEASEKVVADIALNAIKAAASQLIPLHKDYVPMNLATLNRDNKLQISVSYPHTTLVNYLNQPLRADIVIELGTVASNKKQESINSAARGGSYSRMGMFTDVMYLPTENHSPMGMMFANNGQQLHTKFVARQVITDISGLNNSFNYTANNIWMAIGKTMAIRNMANWAQVFIPQNKNIDGAIDTKDIGALNIIGNLPTLQANGVSAPNPTGIGSKIDTKSDEFNNNMLGSFIRMLFHDQTVISIDVPESGYSSSYLEVFTKAAIQELDGRITDKWAVNELLQALNQLTDGLFAQKFGAGKRIFAGTVERIHAGHYRNRSNMICDIRDFDYLYVCNIMGSGNVQGIRDWSDTFLRTEFPEVQRLEQRRAMIERFSGKTAVFTGYYRRLTFSADLLRALNECMISLQLPISYNNNGAGEIQLQMPTADFFRSAMFGQGDTFVNNSGYGGGHSHYGYNINNRHI